MGTLLKIILTTIILFFVWNILKRLFFKKFYSFLDTHKPKDSSPTINKKNKPLKWDAETIDYEEIKPNIEK